jgi:hypothetical protein
MKMIILVQLKKTKKIRNLNQKRKKADQKAIRRLKNKKLMGSSKIRIKKKIKAKYITFGSISNFLVIIKIVSTAILNY